MTLRVRGLAKKAMPLAMSSGWPTSLVGCLAISSACRSGVSERNMSVSISPGAIALTKMPFSARSIAIPRVRPTAPAFDVT